MALDACRSLQVRKDKKLQMKMERKKKKVQKSGCFWEMHGRKTFKIPQ